MERPSLQKCTPEVRQYIEQLESDLKKFNESPLVDSYLATLQFLNNIDSQIINGHIDIFDNDNKPKFEMAHRFLLEKTPYLEQLKYIRKEMSPEQALELEDKVKEKAIGLAEKIAISKRNGTAKI